MPKSTENDHSRRPRVVILGGGFAGVGAATFANPAPAEYTAAVMDATTRRSLAVRLDLFLAYVADEALPAQSPAGFNLGPPPILVRSTETALLFIDGTPVMLAVPNTDLDLVVNANWPLLRHREGAPVLLACARPMAQVGQTGVRLAGCHIATRGYGEPAGFG